MKFDKIKWDVTHSDISMLNFPSVLCNICTVIVQCDHLEYLKYSVVALFMEALCQQIRQCWAVNDIKKEESNKR